MSLEFLIALLQIIGLNIVLSGDNAVVIALAARALPPRQRRTAVIWGSAAAIALRVLLTIAAAKLLLLPYLKAIGALLLLWIGVQLLVPETDEADDASDLPVGMGAAIRTILIADLVMSLDNVLAVAAAAKGDLMLLTIGLMLSIPLIAFGSTLLMKLMERWPLIVTVGGALLGWVAGEMAFSDPGIHDWLQQHAAWTHLALPMLGAVLVLASSRFLSLRHTPVTP
ncbi:TerC family protein [Pelomonas sp. KK5]|uniref:TerC family protein n=1 Tax=Pelomonas sp. KK5 TaxID=1855730 RepID=UPI00097C5621|nr:TerC family protein [Pelomonas sp. KK5]